MGPVRRGLLIVGLVSLALLEPAVAEPEDDCGLEDPEVALSAPAVPAKAGSAPGQRFEGPAVRRVRGGGLRYDTVGHGASGALSGVTVYVSAGHGFTWLDSGLWRTQRGNTHDLVEDFISAETVAHYLIPYLHNMGAYVVPVRESDLNAELAIADDAGEEFSAEGVTVRDDGVGFGVVPAPITGDTNPFTSGTASVFDATAGTDGEVVWTLDVPADGAYNVYVGYVQDPSRASDAHYVVRHPGGEAHFRVDQRRHGSTWVLLGRFYFEAGASPARGAVALVSDSADEGATLSADAVRIGGGVGVIDRGGGVSGRPMFENNSRYTAQLNGAPASVYDYASADGSDDVGTRSRFSAWDHEDGEDAVYIAWHTNAPSPARGTSSFVYGPSSYGPISEFSGVPGSVELVTAVHDELVADARAGWEPEWQDRGVHSAYFGEVNPNHNPEMPAALFEIAFHDTLEDADALRDPRFRRLAARAMAQGVARYIAERDGTALVLPPEPPTVPRVRHDGAELIVTWSPPAADPAGGDEATGYRLYTSRDGRAWDEGTDVATTRAAVAVPADAGAVYVRVTATNAGGESLPTAVVGGRPGAAGHAKVLVVHGFDRLDGAMLIPDDLSSHALDTIERGFVARINDRTHVRRFGAALDAAQVSFDAASADAVAAGEVDVAAYEAVVWALGEESSCCDPLSADERAAIAAYVAGGGKLFVSGSEYAWVLGELGDDADRAFLADVLRVVFVVDDAETYDVTGVGPFADLPPLSFDDDGWGGYDADVPDVLEPAPGADAALRYDGGLGGAAMVLWQGDAGEAVVVSGFPFETVAGAEDRAALMARILAAFAVEADPVDPGDIDPEGDPDLRGGCGCTGGRGGGAAVPALLALAALALLYRRRRRA